MFAIKVDLEKAYDRLNWFFVRETLLLVGFPNQLVDVIMDFVSSATFRILWDGKPSEPFALTRGLQQGDPSLLTFFTLCIERLAHIIKDKIREGS